MSEIKPVSAMGRRSDHSREELRQMALDAAREIIESKGIQGLTTRAVAKRLGYTVGTLYLIFRNYDDLVYALNAQTVSAMRALMERETQGLEDPQARLKAIADAYLAFALDNPNVWRLAFEHQSSNKGETPSIITHETERVLEQGISAMAQLLPDNAPEQIRLMTAAFWSGIHGVCHLVITDTLRFATHRSASALLDAQVDTFLKGLTD